MSPSNSRNKCYCYGCHRGVSLDRTTNASKHFVVVFENENRPSRSRDSACFSLLQVATKAGEPREVILRIYGQILYENPETIVTDSVIYGLLAEKKMGPKLYGIFTGGRVEEYVKSHTLFARDLQRECISLASAEIMGGFHR